MNGILRTSKIHFFTFLYIYYIYSLHHFYIHFFTQSNFDPTLILKKGSDLKDLLIEKDLNTGSSHWLKKQLYDGNRRIFSEAQDSYYVTAIIFFFRKKNEPSPKNKKKG